MKSSHEEIRDLFPEYMGGSLPGRSREAVEAHLAECGECREMVALLSEVLAAEVPDPGELFWQTLPQKVGASVGKARTAPFSLRAFLFRPLPVAATVVALSALIFIAVRSGEMPVYDPLFGDPLATVIVDEADLAEREVYLVMEQMIGEELAGHPGEVSEYSYHTEFASLSAMEIESLYKALENEKKGGG